MYFIPKKSYPSLYQLKFYIITIYISLNKVGVVILGERHLSELIGQNTEKKTDIRATTCNPFEPSVTLCFDKGLQLNPAIVYVDFELAVMSFNSRSNGLINFRSNGLQVE
jgi:hypothetical protein